MHVDDCYGKHTYARFVLNYFRMPAALQMDFKQYMAQFELYCTYGGKRFRCCGASTMGDVWLSGDFKQDHGYQNRVDVGDCSDWGPKP